MKLKLSLLLLITSMSFTQFLLADDIEDLRAAIKKDMPNLPIDDIAKTPVPGLLELISEGQIYYLTSDAEFMFDGSLINLSTRENMTQTRKGRVHMASVNAIDEKDMVVFSPEEATREITVFTDTSCPYCSKLHEEVDELMAAGVKVRYLLYPRAGMGSSAYKNLQSVWCAEDQQAAMTAIKSGEPIDAKTCENPIKSHISLARKLGLQGTPLIYLDSGMIVNGYQPAAQLIAQIKNTEPMK